MKSFGVKGTEKVIGGDEVFIIAEIGKNFIETEEDRSVEEYLENAKKLVDAAVESGADAVKFQTHVREDEVLELDFTSPHFKARDRWSWVGRNEAATPLEEFWRPLKAHCDERGIIFFSTPMSRMAAEKLQELDVALWKLGSGDVQDYVTLNYVLRTKKPVIASSGMISLEELNDLVTYIVGEGGEFVMLYCISQYPCPPEMFNLSSIERMIEKYPDIVIGFSDHSITHDATLAAVKMGAKVIEKHFSFDRTLWGADHKASITPEEMKELVGMIRSGAYKDVDVTPFYGDKDRELEGAGNVHRPYFNKSLMAGADIPEGTVLTEDMIYAMRPVMLAGGLPANRLNEVVGRKVARALKRFDPITEDIIE